MSNASTTIEIHGPALREIRVRSGISVMALAKEVGIQRPYVSKIELGHSRRVSPEVFNGFIRALGITDRRCIMANPYGDELKLERAS